jgi:flagellar FliJ protein
MQVLAEAIMHRDHTLERIATLREAIEEQRRQLCRAECLSAAQRWLAQKYEAGLKQDLMHMLEILAEQENNVNQCRTVLVQKAQDRNLLDKLKERQSLRFELEERKKEQQSNDETATLRYSPAAF